MITARNCEDNERYCKGPIVIHISDKTGFGDVFLAVKISTFLMKKFPDSLIYLIGKNKSFDTIFELFPSFLNSKIYPQIRSLRENSLNFDAQFFEEVQVEVETSIFSNALHLTNPKIPHPKIFIGDYGSYEMNPYAEPIICINGNIGENRPGILIEPDLLQFSNLGSEEKELAQISVLNELQDLLLKLQISGNQESILQPLLQDNSFAFCYYNIPASFRRAALIFAACNRKKNANYFMSLSGKINPEKVLSMLKEDAFKEKLKSLNYTKILFFNARTVDPYEQINLQHNGEQQREFRVYHRDQFNHKVTLDLMRLSTLCGVSGGQTLTEAISLGVVPIPEESYSQFNIIDQLAKHYYQKNGMTQVFLLTWCKRRKSDMDLWIKAGEILHQEAHNIKKIMQKIQKESNLYQVLEEKINRELQNK